MGLFDAGDFECNVANFQDVRTAIIELETSRVAAARRTKKKEPTMSSTAVVDRRKAIDVYL